MEFLSWAGGYVALYVVGGVMGLGIGALLCASSRANLHDEIEELRRRLDEHVSHQPAE